MIKQNNTLYVKPLHQATMVQLGKVGKVNYVKDSTDFAALYAKLARKYLGAMPIELAHDIMQEAFLMLFCTNLTKAFKYFSGSYMGSDITIEKYIATLYARNLITLGKQNTEKYLQSLYGQSVDGENGNEAFDNLVYSPKISRRSIADQEELEYIDEQISYFRERIKGIQSGEIKVKDSEYSVAVCLNKIRKLERRASELNGDNYQLPCALPDDGVYSVEEQLMFDTLITRLRNMLKLNGKYTTLHEAFLDNLTEGFAQKELQEYYSLTSAKVNKIVSDIKETVTQLAILEHTNDKNDLLDTLVVFTKDGEDYRTAPTKQIASPKEVASHIIKIYGSNLSKMFG